MAHVVSSLLSALYLSSLSSFLLSRSSVNFPSCTHYFSHPPLSSPPFSFSLLTYPLVCFLLLSLFFFFHYSPLSLNTSLQFPPLPKHNRLSHRHYIYIYSRVWESIVFCVLVCFVYCVLSIVFCMWESVVSTCSRCWAIVFMSLSRRWLSCKEQWPKLQYWKDACSRDG